MTLSLSQTVPAADGGGKPVTIEAGPKASLLYLVDKVARDVSPEIRQVNASYGQTLQGVWVVNSQGSFVADNRIRMNISVTVTAVRGGLIQTGRETLAYQGSHELLSERAVAAVAASAAEKAVTMLDSRPAPAGRMPVVLANGFGGVLFHEACGHGLEADYILKKASVWEGKKGNRVAGDHIFAYDDGTGKGMWGSARYDDEGTPSERTTLIEGGILTGYMSDRLRGAYLKLPLTGNGRRQDYRHLPYPRMTNTYFGRGGLTPEEIIGDTRRALYAKSLSGGQVNPVTGEFVFGVAEGYLIEDGILAGPVRGATLVGNGPEVLRNIDAVADDLEVKAGMCGKEGQLVPVGSGQPTIRIRELTVGGTGL
jgi:TldD protein